MSAAPLSTKRPLERVRASPGKSHGRVRIVVRMDGNIKTFHRVHGDNEETHQDALTHFVDAELAVSAGRDDRGVTRLAVFALVPDRGTCGLVGPDRQP